MTLKIYDYESGTNSVNITAGNSGGTAPTLQDGTATFTNESPFDGTLCGRYSYLANGIAGVWQRFTPAATNPQLSTRISFRVAGFTGNSQAAVALWRGASTTICNLRIISWNGGMAAYIYSPAGGTNLVAELGPVTNGEWYSFTSVVNGTTGAYTFKLYDSDNSLIGTAKTGTDANLVGTVVSMQVGQNSVEAIDLQVDIDYVAFDNGSSAEISPALSLLKPFDDMTVEPEKPITLEAKLFNGATASSYDWDQISGPTVVLNTSGASCSFTSPSVMPPGDTVVIGVTATLNGDTVPQETATITVYPQLTWYYRSGAWKGRKPPVTLG